MELREVKISSPVVTSMRSAGLQFEKWLQQNNFRVLHDALGLPWRTRIELLLKEAKGLEPWQLTIHCEAEVNCTDLEKYQIFDPSKPDDLRILNMLEENKLPLQLKPRVYSVKDEEHGRQVLQQILPELKSRMESVAIKDIIRNLITKWLDNKKRFDIERDL